ncbi:MAG: ATPase domain-containing protein [Candidatus Micrarchaeota archaeon]
MEGIMMLSPLPRIKTGIVGLDEITEGGFPRGSIITVSGDTGCGKTTLGIQFLHEGAIKYNETGLYISFDEKRRAMYRNMGRFGWDLEKFDREKKLVFIEYPPFEVDQFLQQEGIIRDLVDNVGIERLVVDSIMPLVLIHGSEKERREGMLKLVEKVRNWGCTVILISEGTGTVLTEDGRRNWAEYLSDGLINLYNVRRKDYRERALEVIKMRGVIHETKICPMRIGETGIEVYPNQQLFDEK